MEFNFSVCKRKKDESIRELAYSVWSNNRKWLQLPSLVYSKLTAKAKETIPVSIIFIVLIDFIVNIFKVMIIFYFVLKIHLV